jgi:hypothetical protein
LDVNNLDKAPCEQMQGAFFIAASQNKNGVMVFAYFAVTTRNLVRKMGSILNRQQ